MFLPPGGISSEYGSDDSEVAMRLSDSGWIPTLPTELCHISVFWKRRKNGWGRVRTAKFRYHPK